MNALTTLQAIALPRGSDLTGLLIGLAICGGLFLLGLIVASFAERSSELLAAFFGVPALLALAAAVVLGIVAAITTANDWSATKAAIQQQVKQQYGITLTEDQASSLANEDIITLNDGSKVQLQFSDHKHSATLVQVNYTPVKDN